MSYVSVGQVENLEEAIGNLDMLYQGMESACQAQIACVDARCEVAQAELENSCWTRASNRRCRRKMRLFSASRH